MIIKSQKLPLPARISFRLQRLVTNIFYGLPTRKLESFVTGNIQIDPPIMENICLPPYLGPTSHDDFIPLMKIVKFLQPSIVVELGTAHGNTVANICNQCPTAKVYTVNATAEEQSGVIVTYELTREEIGCVYRKYGFSSRVEQIYENTLNLDLSKYLNGKKVDLAIIDACHDTEFVINDFFKVIPFIREQGIILFHDTHPSMNSHLIGSYKACISLRRSGYNIQHIRHTWWAIWIKP